MVVAGIQTGFSFPALPAGPPSRDNWYRRLLDDPECNGDGYKIQQAYESQRSARLVAMMRLFENKGPEAIKPDLVLKDHLNDRLEPTENREVNCLVFWARPEKTAITLIESIQKRLSILGPDVYLVPSEDLHLSLLELSHRHPMAHLQGVADQVGKTLLQQMLDVPRKERAIALGYPRISFDAMGIALTFVPVPQFRKDEALNPGQSFTYHHLRNRIQELALNSGIEIDTCYTAATAHITIARFSGNSCFEGADASRNLQRFLAIVTEMNKSFGSGLNSWVVGATKGLELQLGYLKYGRATNYATMIGESHGKAA